MAKTNQKKAWCATLLILFGAFFSSFYPELYLHHFFFISGNGLLAYTAFKWRELSLVTLNLTLTLLYIFGVISEFIMA